MPDVLMPRLSDTMTEGVVSQWLMSEGDEVHRGDVLAEIETDKATMDLEAYDTGTLTRIIAQAGSTVPIGEPLAVIGEPGAVSSSGSGDDQQATGGESESDASGANSEAARSEDAETQAGQEAASASTESQAPPSAEPTGRQGAPAATRTPADQIRATPLVRSLARERGIDLTTVRGSGPGGRIVRADLDTVLTGQGAGEDATAPAPATSTPAPSAPSTPSGPAPTAGPDDETVPLSQMRRVTAQRLTESAAAPHFHLTMPVDLTALLAFRKQLNEQLTDDGVRVSVTDLLVRACAVALRSHPEVNAAWAGDHIIRRGHVNVGIAVAIEDGLIVPVVTDADRKTLREIAEEAHDLGDRARAGKLKLDEFTGGTFTVSNLGMFGITEFTAVINPPEAAILAVGAGAPAPVLKDGELSTTTIMRLNLTVDHRVLDGATGASFLRDLVRLLEQPLRIVT
jgi:pyruvate dehydrogenase E2 component (dihydrolipoamide acetyltransferase)